MKYCMSALTLRPYYTVYQYLPDKIRLETGEGVVPVAAAAEADDATTAGIDATAVADVAAAG